MIEIALTKENKNYVYEIFELLAQKLYMIECDYWIECMHFSASLMLTITTGYSPLQQENCAYLKYTIALL